MRESRGYLSFGDRLNSFNRVITGCTYFLVKDLASFFTTEKFYCLCMSPFVLLKFILLLFASFLPLPQSSPRTEYVP